MIQRFEKNKNTVFRGTYQVEYDLTQFHTLELWYIPSKAEEAEMARRINTKDDPIGDPMRQPH